MLPYKHEEEALFDVLRLSRGMTYKSAVADTGLGGGKSVVIGEPKHKSEALFETMGRFVESLFRQAMETYGESAAELHVVKLLEERVGLLLRPPHGQPL